MNQIIKQIALFACIMLSFSLYGQGHLVWNFTTGGRVYSSPTIDDCALYIGSNDSCLYILDKLKGNLKWKIKTDGAIKSKPLLYKESVIYNTTNGFVYCIDKKNAHLRWKFKTEGEKQLDMWDYYLSSPICSDNRVFVGSGDGYIYVLNADDGHLFWKFKTGGIVHATPLVYNGSVYVGSFDGYFYSLDSESGDLIWKFRTVGDVYFPNGEIQKGAVIYKNAVIFGSRDFNVYSIDTKTGRGLWNMKEKGSWVISTPLVVNDTIYFGTSDSHRFGGLNAVTGDDVCSYPLNMRVYGDAVFDGTSIYFGCFNGKLYKLDLLKRQLESIFQTNGSRKNYFTVYNEDDKFRSDFELYGNDTEGSERKILDLGAILSTPIIDQGIIYFADSNGCVYAYKYK